ncbi:ATP-binding protein [Kitasatospora kifunensis]|uniref:Anti-sigma regulatory factor (Ser/Thr protein kinase) n=1 Tax=Kitasatospora kifunensis TaxID=58351 RepID=A0A7W7QZY0_KITKI|nr:ATP-binding protein [Kitasatospora kifunensis]MBB4922609.1 anti-sigma regulatory factor (Ser/Thr protein kinase) [Kitasatospora kifunensis]
MSVIPLPAATTAQPLPTIPAIPAHWRFPADHASVAQARRALANALPLSTPPQLSYDLRLLASELVTNAVRHGARADEEEMIELIYWIADGHHWLAVSDPGRNQPVLVSPNPKACGGRGLLLVNALCDLWAVVPRLPRGKTVVAGIRQHSAA